MGDFNLDFVNWNLIVIVVIVYFYYIILISLFLNGGHSVKMRYWKMWAIKRVPSIFYFSFFFFNDAVIFFFCAVSWFNTDI